MSYSKNNTIGPPLSNNGEQYTNDIPVCIIDASQIKCTQLPFYSAGLANRNIDSDYRLDNTISPRVINP